MSTSGCKRLQRLQRLHSAFEASEASKATGFRGFTPLGVKPMKPFEAHLFALRLKDLCRAALRQPGGGLQRSFEAFSAPRREERSPLARSPHNPPPTPPQPPATHSLACLPVFVAEKTPEQSLRPIQRRTAAGPPHIFLNPPPPGG
jgi:hypothetical protein